MFCKVGSLGSNMLAAEMNCLNVVNVLLQAPEVDVDAVSCTLFYFELLVSELFVNNYHHTVQ